MCDDIWENLVLPIGWTCATLGKPLARVRGHGNASNSGGGGASRATGAPLAAGVTAKAIEKVEGTRVCALSLPPDTIHRYAMNQRTTLPDGRLHFELAADSNNPTKAS